MACKPALSAFFGTTSAMRSTPRNAISVPWSRLASWAIGASLAALFAACGAGGADGFGTGAGGGGVGGGGPSTTGAGGSGGTPPEKEVESSFGAPVATGKYVWIANPTSGRVAYIDASTLEIKLVDAGNGPTYVAAVPDPSDDVALVLNVLSRDATLLRASGGSLSATSIAVPPAGNAWAVSADGHWAIAWTDARRVDKPDPIEGYQDLTVLDLTKGSEKSTDLTVGYRPVAVAFDQAGQRAFAVTQDGVSVIALTGGSPMVVKNVALSDKPADMAGTSDVSITPDGAYALVRRDGQEAISVFSLSDGSRTDVTLPGKPTDLDLSADGSTAVAVIRDSSQVALLPVPGIVAAPTNFQTVTVDAAIGSASLAKSSSVAFFYTNATPSPVLALMDLAASPPAPRTILMRAPILGVFPTADAAHAVVLHDALTDQGSMYPAAVSLAPIALDLPPKIIGLDAPAISIAVAPGGDHALVAAGDEMKGIYQLMIGAMPSLKVQKLALASMPIAAGIVAGAGRGYVAQKHPDGRITFVGLDNGEVRTLTGFELATQVVDGTP
jgi:DNA-binding beta-propeller fold protein YncE